MRRLLALLTLALVTIATSLYAAPKPTITTYPFTAISRYDGDPTADFDGAYAWLDMTWVDSYSVTHSATWYGCQDTETGILYFNTGSGSPGVVTDFTSHVATVTYQDITTRNFYQYTGRNECVGTPDCTITFIIYRGDVYLNPLDGIWYNRPDTRPFPPAPPTPPGMNEPPPPPPNALPPVPATGPAGPA